jgi:hypothetical protein
MNQHSHPVNLLALFQPFLNARFGSPYGLSTTDHQFIVPLIHYSITVPALPIAFHLQHYYIPFQLSTLPLVHLVDCGLTSQPISSHLPPKASNCNSFHRIHSISDSFLFISTFFFGSCQLLHHRLTPLRLLH